MSPKSPILRCPTCGVLRPAALSPGRCTACRRRLERRRQKVYQRRYDQKPEVKARRKQLDRRRKVTDG